MPLSIYNPSVGAIISEEFRQNWGEKNDEYLTTDSADFHARLGFKRAGEFRRSGYKFGKWYDMIWMEKLISSHRTPRPSITPYTDFAIVPLLL